MNVNKINVNDQHQATFPSIQSSNSDFDIRDTSGYILTQFKDGHLKTKNFDSSVAVQTTDSNAELEFIDSSSNCVMRVNNGHIKTKNFNSATLENTIDSKIDDAISQLDPSIQISKFQGKRCAIIGDSISTYSGTMPRGYAVYYPQGNVNSVDKMWWAIVCQKLGMTYVNTSWSGSKVSGEPKGSTAAAACSDKRVQDVGRMGAPDIIICYISCNDWGTDVAVGTWQTNDPIDHNISTTISELRYAYALMLYKLTKSYPRARIFCCSNLDDTMRDRASGWPSNNGNNVSTYEWNKNIKEIAEALGAIFVDLHACGINYANISNFVVDGGLHPNAEGHQLMADYITAQLIANY